MGAKLSYQDIQSDELASSKFVSSPNVTFSTGSSVPSFSANSGSLYVNTTAGDFYLNTSTSSGTTWIKLSSYNGNVERGHYQSISLTSLTMVTGVGAPIIGDLVGLFGAGAWAVSGVLTETKVSFSGCGSQNAGLVAGGVYAGGAPVATAELFNGATWSASGALNQSKGLLTICGSQNAGLVAGGNTGSLVSTTELFNGATWSASGVLSAAKSGLSGCGSQNAGLVAGGTTGSVVSTTELFNGSTWIISGILSAAKKEMAGAGSQNAGLVAGGNTGSVVSTTELFNGATWSASGVLSQSKNALAGAGSQNAGLATGGSTTGNTAEAVDVTELHSQTTYGKIYTKNIKTAKNIGVATAATTALLQGYSTSITYPASVYLVVNKYMLTQANNESDLSGGFSINTILNGGGNTWIYSLAGTPNLRQIVPGNILFVTGATTSANNGTFIITNTIDSSDTIYVTNASGVIQGGAAGTVKICSTLLAKSTPDPEDIIVGKTDASGYITITQPLAVSSILARMR